MTEQEAKDSAATFQRCGWDVRAQKSPIGQWDWELVATATNGADTFMVPTHKDMNALVAGGRIRTLVTHHEGEST